MRAVLLIAALLGAGVTPGESMAAPRRHTCERDIPEHKPKSSPPKRAPKKPVKPAPKRAPPAKPVKRPEARKPPPKAPAVVPKFRVIVNLSAPIRSIDKDALADIFLKKTTFWSNGQAIRPVDLSPKSDVRREFSNRVLNRPVSAVRTYWQQRIFTGRAVPPPELSSDAEAVRFVRATPGAVAYVSGTASTRGVRVLTLR